MKMNSGNTNGMQVIVVVLVVLLLLGGIALVGGLIAQWLLPYTLGIKLGFWKSVLFFILTR